MFICEKCLEKYNNWGISKSYGVCEDCGRMASCYDIPSKQLELKGHKDDIAYVFEFSISGKVAINSDSLKNAIDKYNNMSTEETLDKSFISTRKCISYYDDKNRKLIEFK